MLLVDVEYQARDFEIIVSNIFTASMSAMRKDVAALRLQIFAPVTWSIATSQYILYCLDGDGSSSFATGNSACNAQ